MDIRTRRHPIAAIAPTVAAALALALGAPTPVGAASASVNGPSSGDVRVCTGPDLTASKGALEGAAGSRFLTVRVTNASATACQTMGYTAYRFRNAAGPIGHESTPNTVTDGTEGVPVVIAAGATVKSVLSWTDPGPTVPSQCHARKTTAFRLKIHDVDRYYRLPLKVDVCTTLKYRPHGTRLQ
ncbi:DUF4232 domain-containing protein [Nocardioides sp. LS1]|uniref:DUF4232 domain-containing protein n=1 Tax=Nocardioides sp. LS1 TaxID=1027620 RepID=UPI000F6220B8|nr:DUF4232 domain-containing protein [Nocardioides sp. LS1]GCD90114.1 hypothetical protein NLS1_21200 [Nocardioides sp. LS1]